MDVERRDVLVGMGAVAMGVAATDVASSARATEPAQGDARAASSASGAAGTTYVDFNECVRRTLRMDCDVIGIKFYESLDDVPDDAVHPRADRDIHMATCQAYAMARYNGQTVCMTKEDEWCWAPLVGFGQVDCSEGTEAFDTIVKYLMIQDEEAARRFYSEDYPRFELGKYSAYVVAPLSSISFDPDVVMVYADPFKINWLCLNAKHLDGKVVETHIDGIDSCVYEMVNTMTLQDYQVCFPDCGEIVRARAKQTDAVFTIPSSKLQEFMDCVTTWGQQDFTFNFEVQYEYPVDYTRPPFYNEVFEKWGLDKGEDWALG